MWDRVLQSADQATIGRQWTVILDAWVELEGTEWRALIDEANRANLIEISNNCAQVLRKGFSPSAAALLATCDFHIDGLPQFASRMVDIAQFLKHRPDAMAIPEPLSGDYPDKLRDFAAAKFILGPLAKKQIRSPKGVLIGVGVVSTNPGDGWEDYYSRGDHYHFQIGDAPAEEYQATLDYLRKLLLALDELRTLKFATTALANVLAEVERAVAGRLPAVAPVTLAQSEAVGMAVATMPEPVQAQSGFTILDDLARRSRDIFLRPYLEAARSVFALETQSLVTALAHVALLPPALETVGPLLGCEVFENPSGAATTPLRVSGEPTMESALAELEKQRSHRVTQAYLRRAIELIGLDDGGRLKLIAEDRERWQRVVETRVTTPRVLHGNLLAMLAEWSALDPGCPALSHVAAAVQELERMRPAGERERSSVPANLLAGTPPRRDAADATVTPRSSWQFVQELESLAALAAKVTGNRLPSGHLRKALDAVTQTDIK